MSAVHYPAVLTISGAVSVTCICCTSLSIQEHPYNVDRAHRGSLILPSTIKNTHTSRHMEEML